MPDVQPNAMTAVATVAAVLAMIIVVRAVIALRRMRARAAESGSGVPIGRRSDALFEAADIIRDVWLLFTWRGTHATGLARVAAIAGSTLREAVRRRILWVVPLWFVTILAVSLFLRPFDEQQDSYALTCRLFLFSQSVVVIAAVAAAAAADLNNERSRRTLLTLLVKPVTTLEIVLGKAVGHALVAGVLVAGMAALTWGWFSVQDWRLRKSAAVRLQEQKDAFARNPTLPPPDAGLERVANEGILAVDFRRAPVKDMEIYALEYEGRRYMRAGTSQRVITKFGPVRTGDEAAGPALRVRFVLRPIPTLLFRDHRDKYDPKTGLMTLDLGFTAVFTPGGDAKQAVGVAYPLQNDESMNEDLTVRARRMRLAPNVIKFNPMRLDIPVEFVAWFPLPARMWATAEAAPDLTVSVNCNTWGFYAAVPPQADSIIFVGTAPGEGGASDTGVLRPREEPRLDGHRFRNRPSIMGITPAHDPFDHEAPGPKTHYPADRAEWVFPGITRADAGGAPPVLRLDAFVDVNDTYRVPTAARVEFDIDDRRVVKVVDGFFEEGRPLLVDVPDEVLTGAPIRVRLHGRTTGHLIGLDPKLVRITLGRDWWWVALLKAEAVVWMQAVLIGTIALAAGSFLSWPVAALVVVFVLVTGLFRAHLLPFGEGHELWRFLYIMNPGEKETAFLSVLKVGVWMMGKLMATSGWLAPDLRQFGEADLLSKSVGMTWFEVLPDVALLAVWTVPFLILAYLVMRFRESLE